MKHACVSDAQCVLITCLYFLFFLSLLFFLDWIKITKSSQYEQVGFENQSPKTKKWCELKLRCYATSPLSQTWRQKTFWFPAGFCVKFFLVHLICHCEEIAGRASARWKSHFKLWGGGWQTLFHEYSSCVTGTSCFQTFFKVAAKDWKEFRVGEEKKKKALKAIVSIILQLNKTPKNFCPLHFTLGNKTHTERYFRFILLSWIQRMECN